MLHCSIQKITLSKNQQANVYSANCESGVWLKINVSLKNGEKYIIDGSSYSIKID